MARKATKSKTVKKTTKRSRSRSTKKAAPKKATKAKKVVAKKVVKKRRATAKGPWLKKVYKAKNGATYCKNKRGQVKFLTGASKAYMARLRKMRGKKGKK